MMILLRTNMEQGLIILLVGMTIVYLSLLVLFAVFQYALPSLLNVKIKTAKKESLPATEEATYTSGEEMAAVSAAIFLFLEEAHDEENAILTINQVAKNYSPWSSKIYMTHRFNNR